MLRFSFPLLLSSLLPLPVTPFPTLIPSFFRAQSRGSRPIQKQARRYNINPITVMMSRASENVFLKIFIRQQWSINTEDNQNKYKYKESLRKITTNTLLS